MAQARTGSALSEEIARRTAAFEARFTQQYGIEEKALTGPEKGLARAALSSLVGSIGCAPPISVKA